MELWIVTRGRRTAQKLRSQHLAWHSAAEARAWLRAHGKAGEPRRWVGAYTLQRTSDGLQEVVLPAPRWRPGAAPWGELS